MPQTIKKGEFKRFFAWKPVKIVERMMDDPQGEYRVRTAWLEHVWITLGGSAGSGVYPQYKSDAKYAEDWFLTVKSRINTDMDADEIKGILSSIGVSYTSHSMAEACDALAEYATSVK